ncbi:KPN_02809 family neutral zinc metallopeptidase [Actinotalea fermentans]|uniref:Membrane protein n=1 Tax=Actinotalea fermentans TaxID=43671 RepID=A0A511YVF7_9CELL|nr:neutral zinc metallopeptidase [Actinotalea fermentans]KGM17102.1 neutral zinc metallopeptidase [Actinotalea fermentans ATCC 43279 = JCM 9966 = DSM 3133]GEN79159.1 membrane protein [Actinotalea fermentans]
MTFSEGGSFEGGRVGTRRGGGRGAALGGGGIGLAIVAFLIYQFTGVDVSGELASLQGGVQAPGGQEEIGTIGECSVAQANEQRDCRLSATVQALDEYWDQTLPTEGARLTVPDVWAFDAATSTGCGDATSRTGPFYCPADQSIYLDLTFFDLLISEFGTSGGPLAEMYVTAHEYGHHVQNLLGTMDGLDRRDTGPTSDGVRLELQADCYAGMWVGAAATTQDPDRPGVTFLEPPTQAELAQALSAAEAIGDDHIQEQAGGGVNPDLWTHGSSEQRQRWFTVGYEQGTLAACDTFSAEEL